MFPDRRALGSRPAKRRSALDFDIRHSALRRVPCPRLCVGMRGVGPTPPSAHLRSARNPFRAASPARSARNPFRAASPARLARNPFRATSPAESFPHSASMTITILHRAGRAGPPGAMPTALRGHAGGRADAPVGPSPLSPESFPGHIPCGILSAFTYE